MLIIAAGIFIRIDTKRQVARPSLTLAAHSPIVKSQKFV